jgi:hypothetical protein
VPFQLQFHPRAAHEAFPREHEKGGRGGLDYALEPIPGGGGNPTQLFAGIRS